MAGFNPFAPQQPAQSKAPQLQGVQAPNVAMQDKPGMMEQLAPTVAQKAMGSEEFGSATDYLKTGAKNAWSALTSPANPAVTAVAPNASMLGTMGGTAASGAGTALAPAIVSTAPSAAMLGTMGGTAASGAGAALAPALVSGAAAAPVMAAAAAPAAGALASVAPAAAALGPLGIPLIIGAGLLASGEGK